VHIKPRHDTIHGENAPKFTEHANAIQRLGRDISSV
jgi:hypothetical protein